MHSNAKSRPKNSLPGWADATVAALSPQGLARLTDRSGSVPNAIWGAGIVDPILDLLSRPGKEFRANLAALSFQLAGNNQPPPAPLMAFLELIHAGSLVVDDIEDDSDVRRGRPTLHRLYPLPIALNAGNWLYFHALETLGQLPLSLATELELVRTVHRVMSDCHLGQALDLQTKVGEVERAQVENVVATITSLKTGRLMSLAAAAGALVGGACRGRVEALWQFGADLGEGLQMLDDLANLEHRKDPAKRFEDLRRGRLTWPWAWAAGVLDDTAYKRLQLEAVRAAGRPDDRDLAAMGRDLAALVGVQGRCVVRQHLDRALGRLREHVSLFCDDVPTIQSALGVLEREIARLERSFV